VRFLFDLLEFFLLAGGMAALYHYVPNTPVKWGHAWVGGLFVSVGIELAKRLLSLYLGLMPTYSAVYGAFATLPILLIWIYVAWVIVLLGAVIAAYLPALLTGIARRGGGHGWQFQLALETLQQLHRARPSARRGMSAPQLAQTLQVEPLQLEPVLETLVELDWIGRLNEAEDQEETRYILLADVESTALEPLMRHLLLPHTEATARLWQTSQMSGIYLRDVV
jgi:membrane protein